MSKTFTSVSSLDPGRGARRDMSRAAVSLSSRSTTTSSASSASSAPIHATPASNDDYVILKRVALQLMAMMDVNLYRERESVENAAVVEEIKAAIASSSSGDSNVRETTTRERNKKKKKTTRDEGDKENQSNNNDEHKENAGARLPNAEEVVCFVRSVFETAQMTSDCPIVALILIGRLLEKTKTNLTPLNWMPVIAIGMMLASKVQDDLSMQNSDFALFLPWSLSQINLWEREFLIGIDYNVSFCAEQYFGYFLEFFEGGLTRATADKHEGVMGGRIVMEDETRHGCGEKISSSIARFHLFNLPFARLKKSVTGKCLRRVNSLSMIMA